jgi:hypothetical protein
MGLFFNKKPNALIVYPPGIMGLFFKLKTQLGFTPSKALGGPYSSKALPYMFYPTFKE